MVSMIGQLAPAFDLPINGGERLSSQDMTGRWVVLYFYPKDMTSGCTTQAEAFRDTYADFKAAGAAVVGVSRDSVKRHDTFVDKHQLPFPLISDTEDDSLCEAYGVWVEKSMYGRAYMGIERATFLISPDGRIVQEWRRVKVPGHVADVLKTVQHMAADVPGVTP